MTEIADAETAICALVADRCRARSDQPFLLAIDGRSGTGKSTLADGLRRRLNAQVICGDDFYAGGTGLQPGDPQALAEMCIDRARLRLVLEDLKAGRPARYAPFDWEAFDGSLAKQETVVHPHPVLILEGVYANHPDLRPLADLSVLLCVPDDERERRLHEREGAITEWGRQWHRAEDWYFQVIAHPRCFDVVIGNR